jgi:hypothetical protein
VQDAEEDGFEDLRERDVFSGEREVGVFALGGLEPGEAEEAGGYVCGG